MQEVCYMLISHLKHVGHDAAGGIRCHDDDDLTLV